MNDNYWKRFYVKHKKDKPSDFARFCAPVLAGFVLELGCGNGRDVNFFNKLGKPAIGVDPAFESYCILSQDVNDFIKENVCPPQVYTRMFWHAIDRKTQLNILKWITAGRLFIEARTTKDKDLKKIYSNHKRNYVDVAQLVRDLKDNGFNIEYLTEGHGLAKFKTEDPHIVRVIAFK